MDSEELVEIMEKIDAREMDWEAVAEKIKIPYDLLKLYANSGPVPVTVINNLKKVLEEESAS